MGEGLGVGVIGAGYVGLVAAARLAHRGHRVVCVESSRKPAGAKKPLLRKRPAF